MREECLATHLADKDVAIKTAVDDVKQQMTATMAEKLRDVERQVRDQCAEDYEHTLQEGECSTQRLLVSISLKILHQALVRIVHVYCLTVTSRV